MKALLVVAMLSAPNLSQPVTQSSDDAFADAYMAMSANTLCDKNMFDISLGLKLYAEASGISNPETVASMVQNAATDFERGLVTKHQVRQFCATMRAFVSRKGKPL